MTETPIQALMNAWYTTILATTLLLVAIALWRVWDRAIFLRTLQEGFTLDVQV
jgi:hypothetical protein